MQNTHNNNISYSYEHVKQHTKTNKNFLKFWEDKTLDIYNKDTFYYIKKEYIIFQGTKPHPLSNILIHKIDKINSRNFYKANKKALPTIRKARQEQQKNTYTNLKMYIKRKEKTSLKKFIKAHYNYLTKLTNNQTKFTKVLINTINIYI